jgi:NTE family protein
MSRPWLAKTRSAWVAARFAVVVGCAALLTACAPFNHTGPDSPVPLATVPLLQPAPRVALVLGSGGPRGYAHIGALKVLEEAGIQADLVVGSSVGALLGAFWADGVSAQRMDELSRQGGPLTVFDPSPFADRGWIIGQRLQNYVNDNLSTTRIEQLRRPLVLVSTRRADKAPVFFMQGNVGVAVRASSAIPGVMSPVGIEGTEYEDGDESLPVAVRAARQAGAQFVIAIDVSARAGSAPEGVKPEWLVRDSARRSRIDPEVAQADFVMHPDMGYFASPREAFFNRARQAGEDEARRLLPELQKKLTQMQLKKQAK